MRKGNAGIGANASPKGTEDGSCDVYFGPSASEGKESNWLETVPGKSWFTILRMYGPLEPWFKKTWRPGEIESVNQPIGEGGIIEELEEAIK